MTTTEQSQIEPEQPQPEPRRMWKRPECSFCQRPMINISYRSNENKLTGQTYVKMKYLCPDCDYRQQNEVPRKLALTVVDEECIPEVR
jgi:hypothetical protein